MIHNMYKITLYGYYIHFKDAKQLFKNFYKKNFFCSMYYKYKNVYYKLTLNNEEWFNTHRAQPTFINL